MRFFERFVVLTLLTALPLSAFAEQALPASFQAEFLLYTKGMKVARMERKYTRSPDGNYQYRSETETTGLVSLFRNDQILEVTNWILDGDIIKPLHYSYSHTRTKKERKVTIDFDWGKGQITNSVNGESWNMPVKPGILDKLLYQFAIMRDLKQGNYPISYVIADGGKIKTYTFKLIGEERLETPLGEFHTLKLSRDKPNSKRKTTLWCARELGYLPVRVNAYNGIRY